MIKIRYAQIRELDISNGEGVGCSLFVQGCNFHCYNCFNKATWDFSGGQKWTEETEEKFINLINRPYIKRVSILGGEPLADPNVDDVLKLVEKVKTLHKKKSIWLYTGYKFEEVFNDGVYTSAEHIGLKRRKICNLCDVIVDGRYVDELKEITLKWRGSSNQHIWMKQDGEWRIYE